MYQLNNILLTLLTVGGIGFINYTVTDQLGTSQLYKDANFSRLGYCLVWSIIDFVIYIALFQWLKPLVSAQWLQIVVTLITVVVAWVGTTLLAFPLHFVIFKTYDWAADHLNFNHGLNNDEGEVWDHILNETRSDHVETYFFTLQHEPMSAGVLHRYSGDQESNYQIVSLPFSDDNFKSLENYDELMQRISTSEYHENHRVFEYVNLRQKFVAIIIDRKKN